MKIKIGVGILFISMCPAASGHFFVQTYSLPIPFFMYAGSAGIVLLLSFAAMAIFAKPRPDEVEKLSGSSDLEIHSERFGLTQRFSAAVLFLLIIAGFIGTQEVSKNINITVFWIFIILALPYLVVLFGDFSPAINPWRSLLTGYERIFGHKLGIIDYPKSMGHWPGFLLYVLVIADELFIHQTPARVSALLLIYTLVMLVGAAVVGKDAWLKHAEVFGIQMRLLGMLSVIRFTPKLHFRNPFVRPMSPDSYDLGLVLFILFMLSSTAFDGLHATAQWVNAYWKFVYPHINWVDAPLGSTGGGYRASTAIYHIWQWLALISSPFVYFVVFACFIKLSRCAAVSDIRERHLRSRLIYTVLPIACAYHFGHYFTLLLVQGPEIVRLISDPLGLGWDIFGTGRLPNLSYVLDIGIVWNIQVGVIVIGHVASIAWAHTEALAIFHVRSQTVISQVPMLILMVLLTVFGLWILSLPISPYA